MDETSMGGSDVRFPETLWSAVLKAMDHDRERRYNRAEETGSDIRRITTGMKMS